jgi:hypothetical protein
MRTDERTDGRTDGRPWLSYLDFVAKAPGMKTSVPSLKYRTVVFEYIVFLLLTHNLFFQFKIHKTFHISVCFISFVMLLADLPCIVLVVLKYDTLGFIIFLK